MRRLSDVEIADYTMLGLVIVGFLCLCFGMLFGCTEVTRTTTTVLAPPSDVTGTYSVAWSAGVQTSAVISGDTLRYGAYPCRPVGALDEIGGVFDYDPATGIIGADLKAIGGVARVTIAGTFAGPEMHGVYTVFVLGVECNQGSIVMELNQ